MKNLFEEPTYEEIEARIGRLDETTIPQWGAMDVGQMLAHCRKTMEVPLDRRTIDMPPLKKWFFSFFKGMLYNDRPWKKNLITLDTYKVVDEVDFGQERQLLLATLKELKEYQEQGRPWPKHPVFGHFTAEQWGKSQYKHLDHHLRQFGV